MKGSHPRPADRCPFVLRHSISQVTSFMQLGMLWRCHLPDTCNIESLICCTHKVEFERTDVIKNWFWIIMPINIIGLFYDLISDSQCLSVLIPNHVNIFSCDQAALWIVQSIRPSIRPSSVCLSVCLSVRLLVCPSVTPFSPCSSYRHEILPPTTKVMSMQKVKVRGQRSSSQSSKPSLAVARP